MPLFSVRVCTGLQHQGIFRVSGSQLEVNDIKNSFERGTQHLRVWRKSTSYLLFNNVILVHRNAYYFRLLGNDPLTDEENNHDINSVAGVLKLYFRGLENPLFPKERFNELLSCISKHICTVFIIPSKGTLNRCLPTPNPCVTQWLAMPFASVCLCTTSVLSCVWSVAVCVFWLHLNTFSPAEWWGVCVYIPQPSARQWLQCRLNAQQRHIKNPLLIPYGATHTISES